MHSGIGVLSTFIYPPVSLIVDDILYEQTLRDDLYEVPVAF